MRAGGPRWTSHHAHPGLLDEFDGAARPSSFSNRRGSEARDVPRAPRGPSPLGVDGPLPLGPCSVAGTLEAIEGTRSGGLAGRTFRWWLRDESAWGLHPTIRPPHPPASPLRAHSPGHPWRPPWETPASGTARPTPDRPHPRAPAPGIPVPGAPQGRGIRIATCLYPGSLAKADSPAPPPWRPLPWTHPYGVPPCARRRSLPPC